MRQVFRHLIGLIVPLALADAAGFALTLTAWAAAGGSATSAAPAASIAGVLKDPDGGVITGLAAQISAKNTATGRVYSATIGLKGAYALRGLPAGRYDLSLPIHSALYGSFEQKGVTLAAGQALELDLPIPWGSNLGTIGDDQIQMGIDLRRQSHYVDGPPPRAPDGHPDLTGMWDNIPNNRQPAARIPMKPWAQALWQKLQQENKGIPGPPAFCLPLGATPTALMYLYEFVQTPKRLIELTESMIPPVREIYLDGRKHPDEDHWNPSWLGHSVGHWEGDTLVIDTVGFNEITPGYGIHSDQLHVVERIRRSSVGRLSVDITADDPEAWTGPYHAHYDAGLVTGQEIHEFLCSEDNDDASHFKGRWKGRP